MDLKIWEMMLVPAAGYVSGMVQKVVGRFFPGFQAEAIPLVNIAICSAVAYFLVYHVGKPPADGAALWVALMGAAGSTSATGVHQLGKQVQKMTAKRHAIRMEERAYQGPGNKRI